MNEAYFEDIVDVVTVFDVLTNQESKPDTECTWFYRIYGQNILEEFVVTKRGSGNITLCNCLKCSEFGTEIFEYFSIYLALTWIEANYSNTPIYLWVSSEKFLFDENEGIFSHYEKIYNCAFLRTLGKDLSRLLSELKVEVFHYSYANKEIIPNFF